MSGATLSLGNASDLYSALLGRPPIDAQELQGLVGLSPDRAVCMVMQTSEFRTSVFEYAATNQNWPHERFSGQAKASALIWLGATFDLSSAFKPHSTSWATVIHELAESSAIFAESLPADLREHLGKFVEFTGQICNREMRDAELIAASAYFDLPHYAQQCGIDFDQRVDAAHHYIIDGAKHGLSPSTHFDPSFYLRAYPDVGFHRQNPLLHFLRYGEAEGRRPRHSRSPSAPKPIAPDSTDWKRLANEPSLWDRVAAARDDNAHVVDVIIPVYRGYNDTLACIHSVLNSVNETVYRLIVIDDCSPEPNLSTALDELATAGLVQLFRNEENLGFVGTVNRGMALSRERDVLLLNSDTEVYGDWLDRMKAHAYAESRVATVTPMTNSGTIFSYPYYEQSNNQELELSFPELDALVAQCNAGMSLPVPTGVGFCFYIRRAALKHIGPFDEALFGKGYGEENDFCMRAMDHAWKNIAALDVFVRHTGEVSFAHNAQSGKQKGYRRLTAAHPRYEQTIHEFILRDPLKEARSRIDIARTSRISRDKAVLMIDHGWGGGIERHIKDLSAQLAADGVLVLVASPTGDKTKSTLKNLASDDFPNFPEIAWAETQRCANTLKSLGIGHIHIHSVVGLSYDTISDIIAVSAEANLPYDFTVHDYAPICPRITMIDWSGSYCASPSASYCEECLARMGSPFGTLKIGEWRENNHALLNGARKIIVPDSDVVDRLSRYIELNPPVLVRPHLLTNSPLSRLPVFEPSSNGVRRIGIIGAIGEHKGARLLRLLCADALERSLPLHFIVYGYTDQPEKDKFRNLTCTGEYKDELFIDVLKKNPSDMALFLSVWPETFSYTLDHAFNNALFPIAFDLGAIARRIRECNFGDLLPLQYMYEPARINDWLLDIEIDPSIRPVEQKDRAWTSASEYYETPL